MPQVLVTFWAFWKCFVRTSTTHPVYGGNEPYRFSRGKVTDSGACVGTKKPKRAMFFLVLHVKLYPERFLIKCIVTGLSNASKCFFLVHKNVWVITWNDQMVKKQKAKTTRWRRKENSGDWAELKPDRTTEYTGQLREWRNQLMGHSVLPTSLRGRWLHQASAPGLEQSRDALHHQWHLVQFASLMMWADFQFGKNIFHHVSFNKTWADFLLLA